MKRKTCDVYYDGQCEMCRAFVGKVSGQEAADSIAFHDGWAVALPEGVSRESLDKEIYLQTKDGRIVTGADAILEILERSHSFSLFVKFAKLPFILPLARLVYGLIAPNRRFMVGALGRLFWLRAIVLVGLLSSLMISVNLWVGARFYPHVPVVPGMVVAPGWLDGAVFLGVVFFSVFAILSREPRGALLAVLGGLAYFCFMDQSRWQPWVLMYGFLIAALASYPWQEVSKAKAESVLNVARIVLVLTYFYSGLNKINLDFFNLVFPWLAHPISAISEKLYLLVVVCGLLAPFAQMVFAVGLLTVKYRRVSLLAAIAMHVFILAMLGPWANNWNSVVWPWTAALALLDIVLFTGAGVLTLKDASRLKGKGAMYGIALVVFGILPVLSLFNGYDSYLSAALYSGNTNAANILVSAAEKDNVPASVARFSDPVPEGLNINLDMWSLGELNVPAYPENRIFQRVAASLCGVAPRLQLVIKERRQFNSHPVMRFGCSALQAEK